ncbi:hypothetical protein [Halotalea alkalilenta]|uniref:Uncharacterized protein n=1 Tax=Halotalea alkalilenta TaxID=376489 RepID=A0A172YBX6_9GAMM|nr:hypothetical protein [Halotalea alkalilenta]ANF56612.1 hypothetical protein A5892_03295 [Halotalea alkalilenta]
MDPRRWFGAACCALVTASNAAEPVSPALSDELSDALDTCLSHPPPVVRNLELDVSERIRATSDARQRLTSLTLDVSAPGRPHVRGEVVCRFDKGELISSELVTIQR